MTKTTESYSNFSDFATDFRHENNEILAVWGKSSDPLRRAVAQIIQEADKRI
jgi:hypothetical protein